MLARQVCNATPGSRVSALRQPEEIERPIALPGPGEPRQFQLRSRTLKRNKNILTDQSCALFDKSAR